MKPKIKFSHEYSKFPHRMFEIGITEAQLLQVFKTHYNELSESFIAYDTHYFEPEDSDNDKWYPLPKTDLLVLIFDVPYLGIFTTIRPWNKEKERYYKSKQCEWFDVVLTKTEP